MIDGSTIKKVFVFGCSFSDYMRDITSVYGQIVADKLNAEYIHNGCGCGSNGRMGPSTESDYTGGSNPLFWLTFQWTLESSVSGSPRIGHHAQEAGSLGRKSTGRRHRRRRRRRGRPHRCHESKSQKVVKVREEGDSKKKKCHCKYHPHGIGKWAQL